MDKISVIVPVYNVEKYLDKCITSILSQTYTNIELILIDDGSSDKSPMICDEYAKNDSRVVVVHHANKGVACARNKGLDLATGNYITFVDSDDYIHEGMYERLMNELRSNNADMAICNLQQFDDAGTEYERPACIGDEIVDGRTILSRLTGKRAWVYTVVWNRLYKREIFNEIRCPEGKIREDEFIVLPVYAACSKIVLIKDAYYYYRINNNSIMANKNTIRQLDAVEAVYNRFLEYEKRGWNDLLPSAYTCARNHLEILKSIKIETKEDRNRKKEILAMYRYMMKNARCKMSVKDFIVGLFPTIYFGLKGKMGK